MNKEEIRTAIELHELWVKKDPKGKRADFSKKDLSNQIFSGLNLSYANFSNSNLENTYFTNCNLSNSDFSDTYLVKTKFLRIRLNNSNFNRASLPTPNYELTKSMTGFKVVKGESSENDYILRIEIPEYTPRIKVIGTQNYRASKVKVLEAYKRQKDLTLTKTKEQIFRSIWDAEFKYEIGKTVEADAFDPDFRDENRKGIHFLIGIMSAVHFEICSCMRKESNGQCGV